MNDPENREFTLEEHNGFAHLTLISLDGTNRLTASKVLGMTQQILSLSRRSLCLPMIITGEPVFSAGADLNEIVRLTGPSAFSFAKMGQELMSLVARYPAATCAAIRGYCMGGGLDLALACRYRVASSQAILGHRGAALGLMTGWGGTQRLPRLVGKARALQMFVAAERVHAEEALRIGLIDAVAENPVKAAAQLLRGS